MRNLCKSRRFVKKILKLFDSLQNYTRKWRKKVIMCDNLGVWKKEAIVRQIDHKKRKHPKEISRNKRVLKKRLL